MLSHLTAALRRAADLGRRAVVVLTGPPGGAGDDPQAADLLRRAAAARAAGRREEAAVLYRQLLHEHRHHVEALRGLRDLAVEAGEWAEALELEQRLTVAVPPADRGRESEWLAVVHYELGRAALGRGDSATALSHLRGALRADRRFLPAALLLGDTLAQAGERREALRAWERALEHEPALPVLARLERAYHDEGRPSRMIALYREALDRAPDDLALAVALGRVYLELEMLDEAADQLEKVEVRAPDLPAVHAYLGAVFERRGETAPALEEYRRALRLDQAFDWPYGCASCGAASGAWQDRCPRCGRWNTLRPAAG